ncbi:MULTISPECIES: nuclear transport factor 2 family protein [Lysobacteraceae]|nr:MULTISPECIES: nuclear transport factor 2 family protein [Lysobacter]
MSLDVPLSLWPVSLALVAAASWSIWSLRKTRRWASRKVVLTSALSALVFIAFPVYAAAFWPEHPHSAFAMQEASGRWMARHDPRVALVGLHGVHAARAGVCQARPPPAGRPVRLHALGELRGCFRLHPCGRGHGALVMRIRSTPFNAASEPAMNNENLDCIRAYLADLAAGTTGERLAAYFTADVVQIEYPNRLNPNGGRSDLATLLSRAEQGQRVLRQQSYQVTSEMAQGDRVAVEALWTGVLAVPLGSLAPGAEMKAHFAMFFELEHGKIRVQRNYDCFQP